MKPTELLTFLSKTIPAKLPVLIKGAPGIGKSDIVAQAAKNAGAELLLFHPAISDPTTFEGLPGIVEGQAEFLPFGQLRRLIDATKPTVAFLDDLGQAPAAVQAAAMQLLRARRVNDHVVADCVTFMAATNRRQDRASVSGILEPVKSRFATIVELTASVDDWCMWALAHQIPPVLVAFIRFRPELLENFKPTADISNSPCPRTIENAGRLLAIGLDSVEALAGAAGEEFAAEFLAFLRLWKDLPSIDGILLNPASATVPTEPSALYAVSGALAAKATAPNLGRVLTYAARLPREFEALLVRDAVRRDAALQATPEFVAWAVKNADLLL